MIWPIMSDPTTSFYILWNNRYKYKKRTNSPFPHTHPFFLFFFLFFFYLLIINWKKYIYEKGSGVGWCSTSLALHHNREVLEAHEPIPVFVHSGYHTPAILQRALLISHGGEHTKKLLRRDFPVVVGVEDFKRISQFGVARRADFVDLAHHHLELFLAGGFGADEA